MSLELYQLLPSRLTPNTGVPINQALEQLNGNLALARMVCEELIVSERCIGARDGDGCATEKLRSSYSATQSRFGEHMLSTADRDG